MTDKLLGLMPHDCGDNLIYINDDELHYVLQVLEVMDTDDIDIHTANLIDDYRFVLSRRAMKCTFVMASSSLVRVVLLYLFICSNMCYQKIKTIRLYICSCVIIIIEVLVYKL